MGENPEGGLDPGRVGEQVKEEEEVFALPRVQLTVPAQVCHLVKHCNQCWIVQLEQNQLLLSPQFCGEVERGFLEKGTKPLQKLF